MNSKELTNKKVTTNNDSNTTANKTFTVETKPNPIPKMDIKAKSVVTKKSPFGFFTRTCSSRRHRPYIFYGMLLMCAMAYVMQNFPQLQEQYPTMFWISRATLNAVEILARLGKLGIQFLADIIPFGEHEAFANLGEHLTLNWNSVMEALEVFMNFLIV